MKRTKSTRILVMIVSILLSLSTFSISYATGELLKDGTNLQIEAETRRGNGMFREDADDFADVGLPEFTIDDASSWAERKGFEVVGFLQKFIQPFAIIIFIGSGIIALVGAFGNSRLVSRGFIGMLISLVMYVVVLYAPEIMDSFLNWVVS